METYSIPGFAEPFSSWSHLLAAGVFLFLTIWLVRGRGPGRGHIPAVLVYGFSTVFLLSMSGTYHLLSQGGTGRFVLRCLDHAGIYVLIAGTFTAIHDVSFTGFLRWGIISIIWVFCITGITLEMVFFKSLPEMLRVSIYIGLGWFGVITGVMLWRHEGFRYMKPVLYGGIAYTVGAILDFLGIPTLIKGVFGPHELFHVTILVGLGYHWSFVVKALKRKSK